MKKYFIIFLFLLLSAGHALAATSGQKAVPVCAYFTNTAEMLNSIAVIGFEIDSDWNRIDLSQFIADECFKPSNDSNDYSVWGMLPSNIHVIDSPTWVPQADPNAYRTSLDLEMGTMYVPTSSTLESVKNAYKIVKLDTAKGKLVVEPVKTEKYYAGSSSPTVVNGKVSKLSEGDVGGQTETANTTQTEKVFTDVPSSSPYYKALKYLKDNEIVSGYEDGSFKPGNSINRSEFTKIIVGAVATSDELSNCMANYASQNSYMANVFTDVTFAMVGGNVPVWYFDYVCVAKLKGYVGGYSDGSFRPTQKITFAEASKIITKALGYKIADSTPWYKGYVQKLDSSKAIPTTIKSFNQNITRGEMAEMIWRLKAKVTNMSSARYSDIK